MVSHGTRGIGVSILDRRRLSCRVPANPGWLRRAFDPLVSIPVEDRAGVRDELVERNARHLRVLVPVTAALHVMGFWTGWRGASPGATPATIEWLRTLALLHSAMLLPVLGMVVVLYGGRLARLRPYAASAFVFAYSVFGALVSANAQRARPNIDVFTIALLAGSFLATPARTAVPSALLGAGLLTVGIVYFGTDDAFVRSILANLAAITAGGVVVARLIYASNVREIAARRVMERQREELVTLNASLETKVKEKVGEVIEQDKELRRLNAQLEARVEERSRELSAALAQLARTTPGLLRPGHVIDGRARIVRFLAEGGMGAVYEAIDVRTGEPVAVKLVKASWGERPEDLQRFVREARAGARVVHPAVARTLHVDVSEEGLLYQVQELVEGVPLARALDELHRRAPHEIAALGAMLTRALAAAHDRGVVHRDVKPSNILLTSAEPGLKLLDFGISRVSNDEPAITASSHMLGTPEYMAPEQILTPSEITDRCDVYLVGLVLYRMLAGRGPYAAEAASQYLMAHAFEAPLPLAAPGSLASLVQSCLAKAPGERPSMAALAEALEQERGDTTAVEVARAVLEALPLASSTKILPSSLANEVTRDEPLAKR